MNTFSAIYIAASRQNLRFLVIGGHAVMHHGYVRTTEDIDLLISKEDRLPWLTLVQGLGYELVRDGGTFIQFSHADQDAWDLDLMLTPEDTFQRLFEQGVSKVVEGTELKFPKLEHLLALKLHAIKHGPELRELKDLDDVIRLALLNRVDVRSASFKEIINKHGTSEIYEKIKRICGKNTR